MPDIEKQPMISFKDVSKVYSNQTAAVHGVSLDIHPGEFVSIVGRSGAGKSTLIKMLIAEEQPSHGHIVVDREDVADIPARLVPYYRRKIGFVFQDFRLLPSRTARENVAFAMEVAGLSNNQINEDVPKILRIVGLGNRAENFPHELSGGEKQRIAIGRALALRPKIMIADEPTGNLDPIHTWDIINLLVKINELGTLVILASHDKDIINSLGKRVVSIEKGKIIRDEEKGRYML